MKLDDLATFVAVVDRGTMAAAAVAAGVPKSTISRRVARLEQDLGVTLLTRSSRSFAITEEGRRLHARARTALQEIQDVGSSLRLGQEASEPQGTLVFSAPYDMASSSSFAEILRSFCALYPKVTLEVRLESSYIDLVTEGTDVALRFHGEQIPGDLTFMARGVGEALVGFYASPDYLARAGTPEHPRDLHAHTLVAHSAATAQPRRLVSDTGEEALVDFSETTIRVNDYGLVGSLVRAGMGVGLLSITGLRDEHGELERVLPRWRRRLGKLSLIWPQTRFLTPSVRAFIDFVSERFAANTGETCGLPED